MRRQRSAFSLVELIVILSVAFVLVTLALPLLSRGPQKSPRIKCVNNLKNIGLGFRIFATDNNDCYPGAILASNRNGALRVDALSVYLALTNELSWPKVLYCPMDRARREVDSFTNLAARNISYFASLSATETNPTAFLTGDRNLELDGKAIEAATFLLRTNSALSWSRQIHELSGNVAVADGSVQMLDLARLKRAVQEQGIQTNYLAVP